MRKCCCVSRVISTTIVTVSVTEMDSKVRCDDIVVEETDSGRNGAQKSISTQTIKKED